MTPTGTKLVSANVKAQNVADACNVAYWCEGDSINNRMAADHQRKEAVEKLHELAALFGYTLTAAQEVAA